MVIVSNKNMIKLIRTQKEKQSVTARCVSEKICDSWSMSELDFPLSELRKLEIEEGGEYFCSCMGVDTSPLRAPTNEIVLCCLLCLTSSETVPVRIDYIIKLPQSDLGLSVRVHPFKNSFESFHVKPLLGNQTENRDSYVFSQLSNNESCGTIKSSFHDPLTSFSFTSNFLKGMECSLYIKI